jgi:hypothetical protein
MPDEMTGVERRSPSATAWRGRSFMDYRSAGFSALGFFALGFFRAVAVSAALFEDSGGLLLLLRGI